MIAKHLDGTSAIMRFQKEMSRSYSTNIGTPQGEVLSLVLFTIYLEATNLTLRATLAERAIPVPRELKYADDEIYYSESRCALEKTKIVIHEVYAMMDWNVNPDKTDLVTIESFQAKRLTFKI